MQIARPPKLLAIRDDIARLLEKAIKSSERTCDVAMEDLATDQKVVNYLIRAGSDCGILREISKDVSGPRKRFIRFNVDRNKLLRGKGETIGDLRIDSFWNDMRSKYPASQN